MSDENTPQAPTKQVVKIALDKTLQDVIDSDRIGAILDFDDTPEGFLELDEPTVRELSRENAMRYYLSKGAYEKEKKYRELVPNGERPDVKIVGPRDEPRGEFSSATYKKEANEMNKRRRGGTATNRLEVEKSLEFKRKFDLAWKRPDELQQAEYDGGMRATEEDGLKFASQAKGGLLKSRKDAEPELIAIKYSKEDHEKLLREPAERSKRRVQAYDKQAEADLAKDGIVYKPGKTPTGPFKKLI